MPLKTEPLEEPALNLTSMLDVVMLLIIFFIFGTEFANDEQAYEVQVPTVAEAAALSGQPDQLLVNITAVGKIIFRQEVVTPRQLEEILKRAVANFPNQSVVIRGDGAVRYQEVMDVMAACQRAGVRNLSLANQPAG